MSTEVSVILATRNRADLLEATLQTMAKEAPTAVSWELLVADNGSSDRTPSVLREAAQILPLRTVSEPVAGKNRALNRALAIARGELVVFTDDDILVQPGWLPELWSASRRWPDADIFGGQILHHWPADTPDWLRERCREGALNFGRYSYPQAEGPIRRLPNGGNYALRARVLAGLRFREDLGPDSGVAYAMGSESELLKRLVDGGKSIVYVPSATVLHVIQREQLVPSALYRRSFRYGRGETRRRVPLDQAPRWFGAPRYLWRMALEAALRYGLFSLTGARRRLEAGLELHYLRGAIAEFRRASRAAAPAGSAEGGVLTRADPVAPTSSSASPR